MKYCFDIDNTICSGGVPYEEAKPFPKVVKRINELDGMNEKALREEYKEWIEASEGSKDQPHVLYANQINIEKS